MTKKEQRRQEWIARVADYRASGQTMKAWCTANLVSKDQLRYWLRTLKSNSPASEALPASRWVPLSVSEPSASVPSPSLVETHVGSAPIELRAGFDPQLLRDAVTALQTSC